MAKKATKTETPENATPGTPAAPAEAKVKNDRFIRVFNNGTAVTPTGKLPPQAQCIMNTLEAAGQEGLTREDLNKALTGVLVTRQPVGRIVSYYQKALVSSGAVKIVA